MSEHDDFKAWLKTWALPGNTSREDAMYAAWQARADRTAPDELVAWVTKCRSSGLIEQCEPNEKASNPAYWTDAFPVYTAPDELQAEVERLRDEVERLGRVEHELMRMKNRRRHDEQSITRMEQKLNDAQADAERLRKRLEIEDGSQFDGIYCRDETIKGQDELIRSLKVELAEAVELLKEAKEEDEERYILSQQWHDAAHAFLTRHGGQS